MIFVRVKTGSSNDGDVEKTLAIVIGLIAGVAVIIIFLSFFAKFCERVRGTSSTFPLHFGSEVIRVGFDAQNQTAELHVTVRTSFLRIARLAWNEYFHPEVNLRVTAMINTAYEWG